MYFYKNMCILVSKLGRNMRAIIQRSKQATVSVDNKVIGAIDGGLVVLLGIGVNDTIKECEYIARKIAGLRIFEDNDGKMNNNVFATTGQIMIISNFTLYGELESGYRPSFSKAMMPKGAVILYNQFIEECKKYNYKKIATGEFGGDIQLSFTNDGPVTIIIDTKN